MHMVNDRVTYVRDMRPCRLTPVLLLTFLAQRGVTGIFSGLRAILYYIPFTISFNVLLGRIAASALAVSGR